VAGAASGAAATGLRAARRRRGCELLGGDEGSAERAKRLELKGVAMAALLGDW